MSKELVAFILILSSLASAEDKWRYVPLNSLTIGDIIKSSSERPKVDLPTMAPTTTYEEKPNVPDSWTWTWVKKNRPTTTTTTTPATTTPLTSSTTRRPMTTRKTDGGEIILNRRKAPPMTTTTSYANRVNIFHAAAHQRRKKRPTPPAQQVKVAQLEVNTPYPGFVGRPILRKKPKPTKKFPDWYMTAFPDATSRPTTSTTTERAEQRIAEADHYDEKIPFPAFLKGISATHDHNAAGTTTTKATTPATTTASTTTMMTTTPIATTSVNNVSLVSKFTALIAAQRRALSELQGQVAAQMAILDILQDIRDSFT